MAPRKENRSERRRIATEREKKRIEAFNQQVEHIRALVCPEMSCPTKSKILRAAVDRLNYLEQLAEQLGAMDVPGPIMESTEPVVTVEVTTNNEQVYFENETSSGYNSDDAPVNYAVTQHEFAEYNQNSNSSVEFVHDATAVYVQPYEQFYQHETAYQPVEPDEEAVTKESYDNFFREFLEE